MSSENRKVENLSREELDPMVIFYQTSTINIRQTVRAGCSFEMMAFSHTQAEELLSLMDSRLNGLEYIAEIVPCENGTMYQIKAVPVRQSRKIKKKAYMVKHSDILEYCDKHDLTYTKLSRMVGGCDMYISSVLRNSTYGDRSCVSDKMAVEFEVLGIPIEVTEFNKIGSNKDAFGRSRYEVNVDDVLNYINSRGILKADFSRELGRNSSYVSTLVNKSINGWSRVRYDVVPQLKELNIRVRSGNDEI